MNITSFRWNHTIFRESWIFKSISILSIDHRTLLTNKRRHWASAEFTAPTVLIIQIQLMSVTVYNELINWHDPLCFQVNRVSAEVRNTDSFVMINERTTINISVMCICGISKQLPNKGSTEKFQRSPVTLENKVIAHLLDEDKSSLTGGICGPSSAD